MVLVVDGDEAGGRALAAYFASRGYRAGHVASGEEALAVAQGGRLAVAIVDVALADMSGHVLVGRLRGLDRDLRVLMTTSDYRPELELRARQIGILHYAQKPTDPARLEAIVARALAPA